MRLQAPSRVRQQDKSRWTLRFVEKIYAPHNRSRNVVTAVARVRATLDENNEAWGLNIGSGETAVHSRVLYLDVHVASASTWLEMRTRCPSLIRRNSAL